MIVDQSTVQTSAQDAGDRKLKTHYSDLEDLVPKEDAHVNFYGIVIDAGYPFKGKKSYICTLKVIDPTYNSPEECAKSQIKFNRVTLIAKRLEDLPVVRQIGDIIRIQGATVMESEGS